ncbi:hypothetical protein BgiBS90_027380, partial [Biomphalaria glabrata]
MTFPYIEQSTSVVNLLTINDSIDRGGDQQNKLQIIITDGSVQPAGVTQKLFESKVTFADLVRVCSTSESSQPCSKAQLGNTLLSTAHASTLVSNYLNTYRSYLDQLRKTCGRGDSPGEAISSRTCTKAVPLVLPLARMTPVFSDDSREDPEFLELLKKTTTESIRKLWPHPNKTNIVRTAGLVDSSDEVNSMTVSTSDIISVTEEKSDQPSNNSSLAHASDNSDCTDYKNDTLDSSEDTTGTNCGQCNLLDNTLLTETDNLSHNANSAMKSNGEQLMLSDGGSANVISKTSSSGPMPKSLLKVLNENLTSGDNYYRQSTDTSCQSTNWSDSSTQMKCTNESMGQQMKTSSLDSFLKHQQKLAQQHQLQRQIIQHQQQQQRQQQQLLEQYQQQEQQQQRQQTTNKMYGGFQPNEVNKSWIPSAEENGANSSRSRVVANSQPTTMYNPMTSGRVGIDVFSNGNQTNQDFFPSNNSVQGISVLGPFVDNQSSSEYSELSSNSRTLKASYACLDPSNPMTLSVVPLQDYQHERDSFAHTERQLGFNQPAEEKNCSNSSRSWAELSRPAYEGDAPSRLVYDNDSVYGTSSSGSTLEDRLRRAYARSRYPQSNQQTDATRQPSAQRPILKMNPAMDNTNEMGVYNGQSTQCSFEVQNGNGLDSGFETGNRNTLDMGYDDMNTRYRWNSLSNCSTQSDIDTTGMKSDTEEHFINVQSSSGSEQNSRLSRLYQWKQNLPTANDLTYMPTSRAIADSSRMTSNDSIANSLLSSIQTDRDFSWNASSITSPIASMSGMSSQSLDHQVFGSSSMNGQYLFSDAYLNKVSSFNMEQRRQMSNNSAHASNVSLNQNDQVEDSSLFYDADDARQNTWSWKGRQDSLDDNTMARTGPMCAPTLSQSMQILNNKILAAQSSHLSGQKSTEDNDPLKGKDQDAIYGEVSSEMNAHHAESMNKIRLIRAFSDPNSTNSAFRQSPHTSVSMSHLSVLQQQQQQQQRQKTEESVYKISEELEKTYLDDAGSSTPWHEMQPDENCRDHEESCSQDYNLESNPDKYVHLHNMDGSTMILSDQDLASLRSNSSSRLYSNQPKDQVDQTQGAQISRNQEPPRPRMILGANSLKQSSTDEKVKAEVEESNRRIREMLGLYPNKEQSNATAVRMQDNSVPTQQTASLVMNGQIQGLLQQGAAHSLSPGQISRMQMSGNKIQAPMAMAQQMYCVPNILMPQQSVQTPSGTRQSNLVPIQGMMTSVPSNSRFPQGMIRVPFVDMSRVVYVHQMPVNVSSQHPNNNHNNSSSSNPHVNTSNIITINTNDNDFSVNGQGDKSGRPIRSSGVKSKTTFIKMRSGSEEFTVPILGMRPAIDDAVCPRLIKTRTNPWDQDLDHDFSNSLMSKAVSMENISGVADPNLCNPEVTMMYPDISTLQNGALAAADPASKTATFMQWPASADMHPEMLDMLPVRRAMPEDCGTGRLCWPEMEFLMSSRDQLQSARRSNKPMGSNKANLISIIPKSNGADGVGAVGKETRFEKADPKFL